MSWRGAVFALLAAAHPAAAGAADGPLRPAPRPAADAAVQLSSLELPALPGLPGGMLQSEARPQQVLFKRRELRAGSVCGDIEIRGTEAGPVAGALAGCGAEDAVRVRSVAGIALSQEALMTCPTARALKRWAERHVETAFGRRKKVVSLQVAAHYTCRPRNNRAGAQLSEHGRAQAIDISGFTLANGETVTVLQGWQKRKTRRKLKRIWKGACGPFGTVLGPEADIHHRDHFHLDTARHRNGPYCR